MKYLVLYKSLIPNQLIGMTSTNFVLDTVCHPELAKDLTITAKRESGFTFIVRFFARLRMTNSVLSKIIWGGFDLLFCRSFLWNGGVSRSLDCASLRFAARDDTRCLEGGIGEMDALRRVISPLTILSSRPQRRDLRTLLSISLLIISLFTLPSCTQIKGEAANNQSLTISRTKAKFEPAEGKVLVFAGQDNASIGGIPPYNDGYADHFPTPAGVTLYTGIGSNDGSFGGKNKKGLHGIHETQDSGNGPSNMSQLMEAEKFKNSALAIGLSMVNNEEKVASGELDENIEKLGNFLLSLGKRPVFLRIGYEFDGHPWNHYDKESWKIAFKRIKDKLDAQGVTNTAYVWQSVGFVSDPYELEEWYPGDEYVDWCGFSFFDRWREVQMLDLARKKGKPVFIAESAPTISTATSKFDGKTKETILSNPKQAEEAWEKWFIPYFNMIEENQDVIKAIHYINCNWKIRPMWFENPTFQDVDSRLQTSPMLSEKWLEKMNSDLYLNASENLFIELGINP